MKKSTIISLLLFLATAIVSAQDIEREELGVSMQLGVSLFDGDVPENSYGIPKADLNFAGGITGSYYFLPQMGVIAEYLFLPISANIEGVSVFSGVSHALTAYLSFNVMELAFANRISHRWNVYVNGGIGFALFNADATESNKATLGKLSGETALAFPVEMALEYCINNEWAVLCNAQYRIYNKDNLEAIHDVQGVSNDGIYLARIGVKYRFKTVPYYGR